MVPSFLPAIYLFTQAAKGLVLTHLFLTHVLSMNPTTGPSMLPTISAHNDWIVISKLHRRGKGVKVGDVVSFQHPCEPSIRAVKRVVGLEGDFVGRDTPPREDGVGFGRPEVGLGAGEGMMIQVPEGHCWVIGDNLPHSRDSRIYGPIPLALIRGKVIGRVWPKPVWMENGLQPSVE